MEIESLGELLYACNENRLTLFKGFGEKTQKNVQEAIEFYFQNQGHFLFAQLNDVFPQIEAYLKKLFSPEKVMQTGAYRRHALTIEELEFVINETNETVKPKFETAQPPELLEETDDNLLYKLKNGLKLRLYTGEQNIVEMQFLTKCSAEFIDAFQKAFPTFDYSKSKTEDEIFSAASIPYIVPCMRETETIIEMHQ